MSRILVSGSRKGSRVLWVIPVDGQEDTNLEEAMKIDLGAKIELHPICMGKRRITAILNLRRKDG